MKFSTSIPYSKKVGYAVLIKSKTIFRSNPDILQNSFFDLYYDVSGYENGWITWITGAFFGIRFSFYFYDLA
jgi:hypothetical protein